jgi:hypothetical protein
MMNKKVKMKIKYLNFKNIKNNQVGFRTNLSMLKEQLYHNEHATIN